ncbi:MAG: hypothetical protein Q7U84_09690 [Polynucleobacter sp.]|nr:hypothetical protein [Polynucleobacter sp.]
MNTLTSSSERVFLVCRPQNWVRHAFWGCRYLSVVVVLAKEKKGASLFTTLQAGCNRTIAILSVLLRGIDTGSERSLRGRGGPRGVAFSTVVQMMCFRRGTVVFISLLSFFFFGRASVLEHLGGNVQICMFFIGFWCENRGDKLIRIPSINCKKRKNAKVQRVSTRDLPRVQNAFACSGMDEQVKTPSNYDQ